VKILSFAAALLALGFAVAAHGADAPGKAFYLGSWQIASAAVAPWVQSGAVPDAAESKTLVGKTLRFEAKRIVGPGILACPTLDYQLVQSPPEGLFQGALEEMQRADKSVDPAKLAQKLGFKPGPIQTLQTGCANELDFHFIDEKHAAFGLNDYVYTITKP
jgi:hypothetical protein